MLTAAASRATGETVSSRRIRMDSSHLITTPAQLESIYGQPGQLVRQMQLAKLEPQSTAFIAHAPFAVLATAGGGGFADVSPKGDAPGFIQVVDETTLHLPDRRGNNRVESLKHILDNPRVGLLFFVPGRDETLRVHGSARIRIDPELLARYAVNGQQPKTVIEIKVEGVRFHCGKALIRSKLWKAESQVLAKELPSAGQMIADQVQGQSGEAVQCMLDEAYAKRLY
jgi:PPOX class probable FMN-dependent enzyme